MGPGQQGPLGAVGVTGGVDSHQHLLGYVFHGGIAAQPAADQTAHEGKELGEQATVVLGIASLGGGHPGSPTLGPLVLTPCRCHCSPTLSTAHSPRA